MQQAIRAGIVALVIMAGVTGPAYAQPALGESVDTLLEYAKTHNPDFAAMRHEADAANERIIPAGALPDPRLQVELRDITRMGAQDPTLSPSRVGSTRYVLMQDIPWFGKRDLKREIAELEAAGVKGRAISSWSELASRIKTSYAQLYYIHRNQQLSEEILTLISQLEKIAQVRYAGGLAAQQDVIRAQMEKTSIRSELVMLENELVQARSRMNALLARPQNAPLAEPARLRPLPAPVKLDYAALEERVRTRNPQIFSEDARMKAAEKSRELTYKNRYPDFSVGVSPIQYGNSIKEWELMFSINIPLQQSSRRSQEREAESMLAAARSRKDAAVNTVLSDLTSNLSGLEAIRRVEQLTETSLLPQANLTLQSALASYENGKVDFATVMDAQKQIRTAKQSLIKAQAEGQMRLAELERLIGDEL
jgi:outer membrane protein TolC